jgi:hypothetical protein
MRFMVLAVAALAACARAPGPVAPEALRPAPAALTLPCAPPGVIPAGALGADVALTLWAGDRAELVDCARRFALTVEHYERRDAGLTGAKVPD